MPSQCLDLGQLSFRNRDKRPTQRTQQVADERTSAHPGYAGDPWSFGKPWLCAVPEPSATGEFLRAGSKDLDSSR
jgi:hypothetical protein